MKTEQGSLKLGNGSTRRRGWLFSHVVSRTPVHFNTGSSRVVCRVLYPLLALGLLTLFVCAAPVPQHAKSLDADTIAEYEKLGAKYGGVSLNRHGWLEFLPGADKALGRLPAFRFARTPKDVLLKLPLVNVPFGLGFEKTHVTDEDLKDLTRLTNLAWLDLTGTDVTDEGLAELKNFKNLAWLYLGDTKITDVGLTELKDLRFLTSLDLGNTGVIDGRLTHGCPPQFSDNARVQRESSKGLAFWQSVTTGPGAAGNCPPQSLPGLRIS